MSSNDWHQLPDEPALWFTRFDVYLQLGPKRSIEAAYQQCRDLQGLRGTRPGPVWYQAAKLYRWEERAQAHDQVERDRIRALEAERRFDKREQRLSMIDRMIDSVYGALGIAKLEELTPDEARAALPQLRVMLRDLLHQQRVELGPPAADDDTRPDLQITADDLAEADRIARLHNQHEEIDPR